MTTQLTNEQIDDQLETERAVIAGYENFIAEHRNKIAELEAQRPSRCADHLNFTEATCEDCGLHVDVYGNTEAQFDNCCFPNCGCDGARLCMASLGASDRSLDGNVEGMWSMKTREQKRALDALVASTHKEKTP